MKTRIPRTPAILATIAVLTIAAFAVRAIQTRGLPASATSPVLATMPATMPACVATSEVLPSTSCSSAAATFSRVSAWSSAWSLIAPWACRARRRCTSLSVLS